jgi:signal transduction histidine kinase
MRGPLAGIQGLTRAMRTRLASGLGSTDRLDRQLELIGSSAAELLRTVEQVVELVRLDTDPVPSEARLDCAAVVTELAVQRTPAATARGRHLVVDPPTGPVPAAGDADSLRRILAELLDNATSYAGSGDIRIRLRSDNGHPVVEVSDPGPAIPADESTRIFAPFTRGSAAERAEIAGSGLGLCLAQRLAGRIGAGLRLDSGPAGNTFAVRLRPDPDQSPQG